MQLVSWNVNGIRASVRKGFLDWLDTCEADLIGLQEVRATPQQLAHAAPVADRWHVNVEDAERKGYSGVATLCRRSPDAYQGGLGYESFDREGRLQALRLGGLLVVNGYFPNGSGKDRDNGRVAYKLDFYRAVADALQPRVEAGEAVVVMGDFNTAHEEIDLARPRQNRKTSGFLDEEREELSRWMRLGWVDTFRHLHPERADAYTWWSQRRGVRERNVGWRIDYILASPGASAFLEAADIHPEDTGSDHCPISARFSDRVTACDYEEGPLFSS